MGCSSVFPGTGLAAHLQHQQYVRLFREQAAAYCKDIQKVEGYQAWIIGIVEKGNRSVFCSVLIVSLVDPSLPQDRQDHRQAQGDRGAGQGEGGRALVDRPAQHCLTYRRVYLSSSTREYFSC